MAKNPSPAEQLLQEVRVIPKMVEALKADIEKSRSSVLSSPKWSDMKVQGGSRQSQEDRNVAIIDISDYNTAQIKRLMDRKEEITKILMSMPDMVLSHVLIVTFINSETYEEAMEKLLINNRNKYFALKRKAIKSLNLILNDTEKVRIDTQKY